MKTTPISVLSQCLTAATVVMACAALHANPMGGSYSLTTIHSLAVLTNGSKPLGALIQGTNGNFYGTASAGGTNGGGGVVFEVSTNGTYTMLGSFSGGVSGGRDPQAALVQGTDGNFYGTTCYGGPNDAGSIFKMTPAGTLTYLYFFTNGYDGANPTSPLIQATDGNFYGTTTTGGYDLGTVYKMTTNGTVTPLYDFLGGDDGATPYGGLLQATDGKFYGTTEYGGDAGQGTYYTIDTNGNEAVFYSFTGGSDGGMPICSLVQTSDGLLYGTTFAGGNGDGTVFQADTNGDVATFYLFSGDNDGANPNGLAVGPDQNLYGTTQTGGDDFQGTVYQITPDGVLTTLHAFGDSPDGNSPQAALALGSDGAFYGTAEAGETNSGVIYQITTNGDFNVLYLLPVSPEGYNPLALVHAPNGNFYGVTEGGGTNGNGVVFEISTNGIYTNVYTFSLGGINDGSYPNSLSLGLDGNFYGTARYGGSNGEGDFFQVTPSGGFTQLYAFPGGSGGANPQPTLARAQDGSFYGATAQGTGGIFHYSTHGGYSVIYPSPDENFSVRNLIVGSDGNVYGTAQGGGTNYDGSVFVLTPSGQFTTLYSFTNGFDGQDPYGLVQAPDGSFYGITQYGGIMSSGIVFRVTLNGTLTVLYNFTGGPDGQSPCGLLLGTDGVVYGSTPQGGVDFSGSVFKITGTNFALMYSFTNGLDGGELQVPLVQGNDGSLYGATTSGTLSGTGGIFRLSGTNLPSPGPVITLGPSSRTTLNGFPTTFIVQAAGGAPLSYQWYRNGAPLSPGGDFAATDLGNLALNPASSADAGQFSVIVSNSYGMVASTNVVLAFATNGTPPVTIQFDGPVTDNSGEPITSWYWDFGDGATSTNQDPTHTYSTAGTYYPSDDTTNVNGTATDYQGPSIYAGYELIYNGLVANGGFETGDFTGWTLSGDTNQTFVDSGEISPPHSGAYDAAFATGEDFGYLSQTLNTIPGSNYLLTFWLTTPPPDPDQFFVAWGAEQVFSQTNIVTGDWIGVQRVVTAVSSNTVLTFGYSDSDGYMALDDVSVVAVTNAGSSGCVAPPAGLAQWWRAEGNALDSQGADNGALQGGVTFGSGEVGQAFNLNGSSAFVSTSLQITNPQTFSLSAWFKTATSDGGVILGFGDSQTGTPINYDRTIYMDNDGALHFGISTIYGIVTADSLDGFNDGAWHQVVATESATNGISLSVDGFTTEAVEGITNTANYAGWWRIGENTLSNCCWPDLPASTYFQGQIDEVAIFNTVLSSNSIASIYAAGTSGMCTNELPPAIVSAPANQVVGAGSTVNYTVTAQGSPTLNYQWTFNTTNLNDTGTISGSHTSSLTLSSVTTSNAGTYGVAVSNPYGTNSASADLVVSQVASSLTWSNPAPIIYGTALSSAQLDATANVPGTFAYNPTNGTILTAGVHTLSVTFTPTDTNDYTSASTNVSLTVLQASPGLAWSTPAPITYGTPLSSAQLDATAMVPGAFAYTPTNGTVLAQGANTLSVTFTPTDTTNYTGASTMVSLQVNAVTVPSIVFVHSTIGDPWDSDDDEQALDRAFGSNWRSNYYETVVPSALFSPSNTFIFLEGGDDNANAMNTFLSTNLGLMQSWVSNGGSLFLNAAPNQGGNINFGFGVTLTYPDEDDYAYAAAPSNPIFAGPYLPVGTSFTGSAFSHATVSGVGLSAILTNSESHISLGQMNAGLGHVLFGGMTLPHFHDPEPESTNLLANILIYGAGGGNFGTNLTLSLTSPVNGQTLSAPATVTLTATVTGGSNAVVYFYNANTLLGSASSSPYTLTISNLSAGSYPFTAVVSNFNGQTLRSPIAEVTVNIPGTELINFDALDTTGGAVGGTSLSNYLAGFGVTISNVTLGSRLVAVSQNNYSGSALPVPSSLPNLFTQVGLNQPVAFSLNFASPQQSFTFTRVALNTNGTSGVSHPAWTAHIFDASGVELESVSEPLLSSVTNIPARTFTLTGTNIVSVRFNSDNQQIAAFAGALLDDFLLSTNAATNALAVSLGSPVNGANFTAPATIPLAANVSDSFGTNYSIVFYSGAIPIGTNISPGNSFSWTNVLNGTFVLTAKVTDASGYAISSGPVTVNVAPGGNSLVVNFDSLATAGGPVGNPQLDTYLATNGMMNVSSNSSGTSVVVENQANVAGGGFVTASSLPNILTQTGSNGPVSFIVNFSNLLTQFSFTRPQLMPNPFVTHPAWQIVAYDALGQPLSQVQSPVISSSSTNIPSQTYTVNGQGIASIAFNSQGTGLQTFNAMLLDDFILTKGQSNNLPPAVVITTPTNGQVFTSLTGIPISAKTAAGTGTITNVSFFYNGANLAGSAASVSNVASITWTAPSNGFYALTAVAANNSGLTTTSAVVNITIANGFAIIAPPASQTIGVSNTAVFTVTTTSPTATYQWQLNGSPISGATGSAYTIVNAQTNASGNYTVVASSGGISITSQPPAVLTVLGPPTIGATSPLNPVVNLGDTVTMSVSGSDAVPFYYQWQLNGTRIAGATNNFYTISNAQPFNSGNYQVVVANAVASTESPVFNIAVNFLGTNAPPTTNDVFASSLTIDPTNGPSGGDNSGSPLSGELAQIAGKPAGRFLWYNWTAGFTGIMSLTTRGSGFDTLMGVYTGTNVAALTTVAQDDDSGGFFTSQVIFNCQQGVTYQIAVAGYKGASGNVVIGLAPGIGFQVLNSNLTETLPVIITQPQSQIVTIGSNVTLNVAASNATSYQWYFSGAPVAGVSSDTLVISNFPASAVGNYYALAVNDIGSAQSATATVEIATDTNTSPTRLSVDKFGDSIDLSSNSTERLRPEDAGGDTGGFTLSQSFSTVGATKEEGEPNHAGQPGGASYWYSYTAHGNGALQFNTAGSGFNTILAIYTGPGNSFFTLVNVGAAYVTNYLVQGQPIVLVSNVTAGTTYYIAIDGYQGASGAAHLNIVLNQLTNVTAGAGAIEITNNTPVIAITSPGRNFLTTSSNIVVRGTVKGVPQQQEPILGYVQMAVNSNGFGQTMLDSTNFAALLERQPNGSEAVVAQETITWSSNLTLVPGANVITVQSVQVQTTNSELVSVPVTETVFYVPALPSAHDTSTLTLLVSPPGHGRVTGLATGATLEVNKVYTVKALPIGNWLFTNWTSGSGTNGLTPLLNTPTLSFVMTSNLVLQANFVTNPFPAVAGNYNGLFYPSNGVTEESSGFFTATLPVSGRGNFTARLAVDGGSYPFSGSFDLAGDAAQTVKRSGKTPLTIQMHVNLGAPDDALTGSVIDSSATGWTAGLFAERAPFSARVPATNFAGRYTLVIPPGPTAPTNEPGGYGYATVSTSRTGRATLAGRLGDGTPISQSVPVARDGDIPLYVSLYSHKGSLLGWLTLTNTSGKTIMGTNLTWIKLATRSRLYPAGFTNAGISILGSGYVPPGAGADNFVLTNGTLTVGGGNLSSAMVFSNMVVNGNKLTSQNGGVEGSISPATGDVTLTFTDGSRITARGVVLQDTTGTNAAGSFLGSDESGFFLLQP